MYRGDQNDPCDPRAILQPSNSGNRSKETCLFGKSLIKETYLLFFKPGGGEMCMNYCWDRFSDLRNDKEQVGLFCRALLNGVLWNP